MRKGYGRLFDLQEDGGEDPLHERIALRLRKLILEGALEAGARLPAQRLMASDLRVSRNTIIAVLEKLASEGLVESRLGSGTYVAREPTPFRPLAKPQREQPASHNLTLPLDVAYPGLDLFPMETWNRLQTRRWRRMPRAALDESDPAGWFELRALIASYAAATRGVRCAPEQIFIVPSAQVAVELVARALAQPGEVAWIEDPGYWRARDSLRNAGLRIAPVPVDGEGFDVALARAQSRARLAFVTPSSHFPTGVALSKERRAALLAWARSEQGWIIEDDFNSEFCFEGRAPPPLVTEAGAERVIYVATFNNVMFPSLRLAYLIAPEAVADLFRSTRTTSDRSMSAPLQMVLHDFIEEGYLAAHVRASRQVYGERREALRNALRERLGGALELRAPAPALHVVAWLPPRQCDLRLKEAAARRNLVVSAFGAHAVLPTRPGLFLGFAGFPEIQIRRAVDRLAATVEDTARRSQGA